jgi:hypothetical protein
LNERRDDAQALEHAHEDAVKLTRLINGTNFFPLLNDIGFHDFSLSGGLLKERASAGAVIRAPGPTGTLKPEPLVYKPNLRARIFPRKHLKRMAISYQWLIFARHSADKESSDAVPPQPQIRRYNAHGDILVPHRPTLAGRPGLR